MERKAKLFKKYFGYFPGKEFIYVSAPGRVNLIGEHLDYNDGVVMPVAISRHISVLAVPVEQPKVRVFSESYQESVEWRIQDIKKPESSVWANYVKGVFAGLAEKKLIKKFNFDADIGFDMLITSNVPVGAGLSSSAALEAAVSYAILRQTAPWLANSGEAAAHFEIAKLCQEAEHKFAHVQCGLMDQVASIFSRQDHVLLFDAHLNTAEFTPFFKECVIAIIDSGIRRSLADSRYNERNAECEAALKKIQEIIGLENIRSWRNLSPDFLRELSGFIPNLFYKRACHIVSEMARVAEANSALLAGNRRLFGALMNESHQSLSDNFEVSTPEIDLLQNAVARLPGVYGARLTGAGFGGCIIALLDRESQKIFRTKFRRETRLIFTRPASGVIELLKKRSA